MKVNFLPELDTEVNFLLELGTEELPPGAGQELSLSLIEAIRQVLQQGGIAQEPQRGWDNYDYFDTPRRIAVLAQNLPAKSPTKQQTVRGPAKDAPAKAIEGFCKRHAVTPEQLQTDAEGRLVLQRILPGKPMADLLAEGLPDAIRRMPKGRTMRWGEGEHEFIRPVRWILALLDEQIVKLDLFGLSAGRQTFGHRIYSPHPLDITDCHHWELEMREQMVEPDFDKRRRMVEALCDAEAKKIGGVPAPSAALYDEITDLVEWPQPLLCRYDQVELPEDVICAVLEKHQRCVPLVKDNNLFNYFIAVANPGAEPQTVVAGNERVVRARLEDARFFYEQDRRLSPDQYLDKLGDLMFHRKLGTMAEKSQRLERLVQSLSREITGADAGARLLQAARYCKIDQVSLMVQEFPELEGTMAGHYLDREVQVGADVIVAQHYQPRTSHDSLPTNEDTANIGRTDLPEDSVPIDSAARLLALADKLDSLVGFFAAGEKVTANRDPMGMRRLALGICRLIVGEEDDSLNIAPKQAVALAARQYPASVGAEAVQQQVSDFIWDRFVFWLSDSHDDAAQLLPACLAVVPKPDLGLADAQARLEALAWCGRKQWSNVCLEGYRRCHRILQKAGLDAVTALPSPAKNAEPEDEALLKALKNTSTAVAEAIEKADYYEVMRLLEILSEQYIGPFFDRVMIEADDPQLRLMRLGMLGYAKSIYHRLADFSQIIGLEGY